MQENPIAGVLALLRLLKTGDIGPGAPGADHIRHWFGIDRPMTTSQLGRASAYICDLVESAEAVIRSSALSEEAQVGLLETTSGLKRSFSLDGLTNGVAGQLRALDAQVSAFSILTSAYQLDLGPRPVEVDDLIKDVERMSAKFEEAGLAAPVCEVAQTHLAILRAMLQNIEVFGVTSAMATYYEMVLRVRAAAKAASTPAEKMAELWPEIERWAGRLAIIDSLCNSGTSLIGHASAAMAQLPHLPSIAG